MSSTTTPPKYAGYVGKETLILLSFPMMNHGGLFAHWLRNRLMDHYNLYSTNAVYCDCVASRHVPVVMHQTGGAKQDKDGKFEKAVWDAQQEQLYEAGASKVMVDTREQFQNQGYMPIGAQNKAWDENFKRAMSEAKVMVFVYTADYADSPWCMQEWAQFHRENAKPARRGAPLRGVVMLMDGSARGLSTLNMTVIPMQRVYGLGGILYQTKSVPGIKPAWGISEADYGRLIQAMDPVR
jgi:hypothetical protein